MRAMKWGYRVFRIAKNSWLWLWFIYPCLGLKWYKGQIRGVWCAPKSTQDYALCREEITTRDRSQVLPFSCLISFIPTKILDEYMLISLSSSIGLRHACKIPGTTHNWVRNLRLCTDYSSIDISICAVKEDAMRSSSQSNITFSCGKSLVEVSTSHMRSF